MHTEKSRAAMQRARQLIPGGVNSPVRAFGGVGGDPVVFAKAQGAWLTDVDGNRYIDYIGSWGPAILGHAHPEVVEAVAAAAQHGLSFGAPTEAETELAQRVREFMPSLEMLRFVSSGTEATMTAIRLARAYAKRDKIIKFTGCYHGHADMLLVKAGSGALTLGFPDSPGVPADAAKHTLVVPFNDVPALEALFASNPDQIAAIIVEPIIGNAGFIRPKPGYLQTLRKLCSDHGAVLIFDEVMTGFRVGMGGVQGLEGITPDLTTLGKVIGGGLPIAAYGGKREIMSLVAPLGPMYQAGTLSGNPLSTAAGLKTLEILARPGQWAKLSATTQKLVKGFKQLADAYKIPFIADGEGGMFGFFFHAGPVWSLEQAKASNIERFRAFFHGMLQRGVYLAPSAFEAGFISLAHGDEEVSATLARAEQTFKELA